MSVRGCLATASLALLLFPMANVNGSDGGAWEPRTPLRRSRFIHQPSQTHPDSFSRSKAIPHRSLAAADPVIPVGVWSFQGYGYVLQQSKENATALSFDETANTCIPHLGTEFLKAIEQSDGLSLENPDLAIFLAEGDIAPIEMVRTDTFQRGCSRGITPNAIADPANYTFDALENWNVFVETFTENYAFFEIQDMDWQAVTDETGASLTSNSTEEELALAMISVMDLLEDIHVDFTIEEADFYYVSRDIPIGEQLATEFDRQTDITNPDEYTGIQLRAWITSIGNYLDLGYTKGTPGEIVWGTTADATVGYLQIMSFGPNDMDIFLWQLDQAFKDVMETHTLILDLRLNGGGDIFLPLHVVKYFTEEPFLAFSKATVKEGEFMDPKEIYVDPVDGGPDFVYKGKVMLMTSRNTVSAAEIFVVAMTELPQVTLIGQNTAGGIASSVEKRLPVGWQYSLSNEMLMGHDGAVYEKVGIPPDILLETEPLPLSDRQASKDTWFETVLVKAEAHAPVLETDAPSTVSTESSRPPVVESPTNAPANESSNAQGRMSMACISMVISGLALKLLAAV